MTDEQRPHAVSRAFRKDGGTGSLKTWPILLLIVVGAPLVVSGISSAGRGVLTLYDTVQEHGRNTTRIETLEIKDGQREKQLAILAAEVGRLATAVERSNEINEPIRIWLLKNSLGPSARGGRK